MAAQKPPKPLPVPRAQPALGHQKKGTQNDYDDYFRVPYFKYYSIRYHQNPTLIMKASYIIPFSGAKGLGSRV